MCRAKWLLAALLVVLSGNRIAFANPPACPKLPQLWHGALCLVAGQYERTIAICDKVLHGEPDNRCAYVLRGYAHLYKKNEDLPAIADFNEALRRGPNNAALHVVRARAYQNAKDYDRAIADCTEGIQIDPSYAEAYAWRAGCYMAKRVMDKTVADYSIALRYAPFLAWARCGRAYAYMLKNEPARALADLEAVLRTDPGNRQAHLTRCSVYLFNLHDWDRVIAESSERIQRHPEDAAWYVQRSVAYLAKGEKTKGLRDGTTAASLKPGYFHLHSSHKAHSLTLWLSFGAKAGGRAPWEDDSEERIAACTKRLAGDPNNVAAYYERGYALYLKRENERAIADFDEIIRRDPADAAAFRIRGYLHVKLGTYTDALGDFATAMRLDPGNADNYAGRALAFGAMKKYKEAQQDCSEAVRLDPHFVFPHTTRGWVYECSNKYDEAIADYSESIRLSPVNPDLYLRRGKARCCVWDCEGAIADYKKAVELAPANAQAKARLAGVLSSCSDVRLRDGQTARKLATAACEATSWRDWVPLDSLAAACAECGEFDTAVKWATKAGELAPDSQKSYIQKCLKLYRAHKPYRVTPPARASASPSSK